MKKSPEKGSKTERINLDLRTTSTNYITARYRCKHTKKKIKVTLTMGARRI